MGEHTDAMVSEAHLMASVKIEKEKSESKHAVGSEEKVIGSQTQR